MSLRSWSLVGGLSWGLASCGCGSPVVDPGRGTLHVVSPTLPAPQSVEPSPAESAEVPQVPAESVISGPQHPETATYHTVKAGETLSSIAKRYGLTAEQLRSANGLDASAIIQPQQLLFIPKHR